MHRAAKPGRCEYLFYLLLAPFLDFILTFMGSPKWVKNPHLRARLAESLENLLPAHNIENVTSSNWQRTTLFNR